MKKRIINIFLALAMAGSAMAGCGSASKEETESAVEKNATATESTAVTTENAASTGLDVKSITVATSPGYEPFEYKEGDQLVGYDVEIWEEFAKRTGIEVKWEFTDFSGLLGLLDSGKADAVSAQMSETPERLEKYCFSTAVDYYGSCVVVAEENEDIKSINDLAGKTVGCGAGNEMKKEVEAVFPNGEVTFEIYQSATLENMLSDLMFGRIDAVLAQDIQTYMAMKKNDNLKIKVLEPFSYDPAQIIFHKDNTKLRDAMNQVLDEMREDGTLKELSMKYIGNDITVKKE